MRSVHREDCPALGLTCRDLQGVYTHRTQGRLTVHGAHGGMRALGPFTLLSRAQSAAVDYSSGLHASLPNSRERPAACPPLPHSTPLHTTQIGRSRTSHISRNQRSSSGRSFRRARPRTAAPIAPKLVQALEPAFLTARECSPSTKACTSSLQTAAIAALRPLSSPHDAAQCTRSCNADSSDGPEQHFCKCIEWGEHMLVSGA